MIESPQPDTDELLASAAAGDGAARHALLDRHRPRLRRMLSVRLSHELGARIDGSDVVQETLAEADARLPEYLGSRPVPFYPWLRALAERKLIDACRHHRRERRSVGREQELGLPDGSAVELARRLVCPRSSPSQSVARKEVRDRVRSALEELGEKDREVLVLYHLEQLTAAEVAGVLGISEEAVRSRQRRALLRLTQLLGDLREELEG